MFEPGNSSFDKAPGGSPAEFHPMHVHCCIQKQIQEDTYANFWRYFLHSSLSLVICLKTQVVLASPVFCFCCLCSASFPFPHTTIHMKNLKAFVITVSVGIITIVFPPGPHSCTTCFPLQAVK